MTILIIIGGVVMTLLTGGLVFVLFATRPESENGAFIKDETEKKALTSPFRLTRANEADFKPLITGLSEDKYIRLSEENSGEYYTYLKIETVDLMDISNEELERRMRGFAKFIEANVNGTQLVGFSTKIETATQRQHLMRRLAKTNDPKNIELLEIEMAKNYEAENTDQEKVFYIKVFGRTLATLKTRMSVLEAVSKDFPYEQVVGKLKLIDIEQKIVGNR